MSVQTLDELKQQILELLTENPTLLFSIDELVEKFGIDKWSTNRTVSRLDDEGLVQLRVKGKKVYVQGR